jgi:hypothetical protein
VSFERDLDRRIKALPARRAPRGLSARILAAAELRSRPWHARPFWTWSPAGQGVFLTALTFGAAALAGASGAAGAEALARLSPGLDWLGTVAAALARAAWTVRAPMAAVTAAALTLCLIPTAALAALPRARITERP